ncbi:hypothetical protein KKI24_04690 [bacterium]|nr:hypothetical protein [bacterium]
MTVDLKRTGFSANTVQKKRTLSKRNAMSAKFNGGPAGTLLNDASMTVINNWKGMSVCPFYFHSPHTGKVFFAIN